ncbi:MAG: P-loop NTPase [Candidatus Aenigmarchaeota archaeon]|nr:P-loop NTPase [Candidatus Aenigmarchaeota archaeon]
MRIIGVVSGKGGVGKTTIVANIGVALSKYFGKRVAILDTNLSTPNLSMHFGMDYFPVTVREVLKGKAPIMESIYIHPDSGVRIIPAPINIERDHLENLGKIPKLYDIIRGLDYDFIIADSSPGLGLETISAMKIVDEVIGVTTPDIPSVISVYKSLDLARSLGKEILGVIVNRWRTGELLIPDIEYLCDTHVISVIPEDVNVFNGMAYGKPVVMNKKYAASSTRFRMIASYILGEEYKPSLIERILRRF